MMTFPRILGLAACAAVGLLAVLPASAASGGSFAATGALLDGGRQRHEALLLDDGRVMVLGGAGNDGSSTTNDKQSVELYTPAAGTWSLAAPLPERRSGATSHKLADGRVLVAGGGDYQTVWSNTRLWSPVTGAWTSGPNLHAARYQPLGVRLLDGRVLVAGGWPSTNAGGSTLHMTAEIVDPVLGVSSVTGSMVHRRGAGTATLLADGRVLVAGGHDGGNNGYVGTTSCQVFDPVSETWSVAAPMSVGRAQHCAVRLLDGRVLVVGGDKNATGAYLDSAEIYDPVTDTWSGAGTTGGPGGSSATLTLLADGSALLAGGLVGPGATPAISNGAALFNPDTGTWTAVAFPHMLVGRFAHASALLADGRVLVTGGFTSFTAPSLTTHCEVFTATGINQPPTAHAGTDDSRSAGSLVTLSGAGSFDDNTASSSLLYAWSFVSKPAGSTAVLAGSATSTPSFTLDAAGDYVIALVVTDEGGLASVPDEVVVSSTNLVPTADAGPDVSVEVGTPLVLAGSAFDAEGHALTYAWTIQGAPAGSTAALSAAGTLTPGFTPDVAGTYHIALVASDPYGASGPDIVLVTATPPQDDVGALLEEATEAVLGLAASAYSAPGHRQAMSAQLREVAQLLLACADGPCPEAVQKVERLLERTDGYVLRGSLDTKGAGKDWIVTPAGQQEVYDLLAELLDLLTS